MGNEYETRVSATGREELEVIGIRGQNIEIFIKNIKFQDLTVLFPLKMTEDSVIFINGQIFWNGLFNLGVRQIKGDILSHPAIKFKEVKKLPQAPSTRLFDMDGRYFEITNKSS